MNNPRPTPISDCDVFGIGAALTDTEIVISEQQLTDMGIAKGVMTLIDGERRQYLLDIITDEQIIKHASGGSAANTIVAHSLFGGNSFFSGIVARDKNGERYLDDLSRARVHYNRDKFITQGVTGTCLVFITPDAERTMNTYLGINAALSPQQIDTTQLAHSTYLYMESYLLASPAGRESALYAHQVATHSPAKIVVSFSDPHIVDTCRDYIAHLIEPRVDIIFCNKDEAFAWTQTDSLSAAAEKLQQYTDLGIITCGADGVYINDCGDHHFIDAVKVNAVDVNGAGDMFAGAFLYSIIAGKTSVESGNFAAACAARLVTHYGPRLPHNEYQTLKEHNGIPPL